MSALGVSRYRRACVLILACLLASCSDDGASTSVPPETSTAPPSEPSAPGPDEATSLFVLEANEGEAESAGDDGTNDLSLTGVGGVTWFADRPAREAGDESLAGFVAAWPDRFAAAAPNAALTIGEGDDAVVAIVTLSEPVVDADTVRFRAAVVDPAQAPPSLRDHADASEPAVDLPETFDRAALFVDPSGGVRQIDGQLKISGAPTFDVTLDLNQPTTMALPLGEIAAASVEGDGAITLASFASDQMRVRGILGAGAQVVVDLPLGVAGPAVEGNFGGNDLPVGAQVTLQLTGGDVEPLTFDQPFSYSIP